MPTTTASNPSAEGDKALLDAIEQQVMERNVKVELAFCWANVHRSDAWKVTYKLDAKGGDNKQVGSAFGGGVTLREAMASAFAAAALTRLS